MNTLDTIDAGTLTDSVRDGLDCFDCGAIAPPVMKPVGRVYAPGDSQGWQVFSCCRDTAVSAVDERTERLSAYSKLGNFERTLTDYQSPTLTVCIMEHANGALWTITRNDGHELSAADSAYLESVDYLSWESEHSWTIDEPGRFSLVCAVIY